jgi:hypothetical protein
MRLVTPSSRRARRRFLGTAAATLAALAFYTTARSQAPAPSTPVLKSPPPPALAHVRVMWMHNPAERAVIAWTTPAEGASHTVYYDTEPRQGRLPAQQGRRPAQLARGGAHPPARHSRPLGRAAISRPGVSVGEGV